MARKTKEDTEQTYFFTPSTVQVALVVDERVYEWLQAMVNGWTDAPACFETSTSVFPSKT